VAQYWQYGIWKGRFLRRFPNRCGRGTWRIVVRALLLVSGLGAIVSRRCSCCLHARRRLSRLRRGGDRLVAVQGRWRLLPLLPP